MAAHTRAGDAGISRSRTPSGWSASNTAFITAAGAPTAPASPTPFAPSGLIGVGVTVVSNSKAGKLSARGSA